MQKQHITLASVPVMGQKLYALVPANSVEAHRRLSADDPVWHGPNVYLHFEHVLDVDCSHCRLCDRIKFWLA